MTLALMAFQAVEKTFNYVADRPLTKVNLAGSFNGWDKEATPMRLGSDGRTWSTTVKLTYGRHQYKFVLNGDEWIVDPKGKTVSDGNGHDNSELEAMPADYELPASPQDGRIAVSGLRHNGGIPDLVRDRDSIVVRLRVRPNDVAAVQLSLGKQSIPMVRQGGDAMQDIYEAKVSASGFGSYRFRLAVANGWSVYDRAGLHDPGTARDADRFTTRPTVFRTPTWPEQGVTYQIFPDRFANGDKKNDLKGTVAWNANPTFTNRFGGDVAGVKSHVPYLKALGIKTLYATPVFESPSNHRYDATDYRKLAPDFGTNTEFGTLTQTLRAAGIRTVMDFAFNHTATNSPWFMDLRQNGEKSKYASWYFAKSYPIKVSDPPNYVGWAGFASMPKLNAANPAVQQEVLKIVDFWRQNSSLAGVRLDVAQEVDPSMWRALRRHIKPSSPEFWIVGENWTDGTLWLSGDQWDSQMGYQFREAAIRYYAEQTWKPSELMNRLMGVYASYAPGVSRSLMNLLSSHDTPRFLTLCKGDADRHRLAAALQLTWPGSPSIYYGEELGMAGGADPENRRGMRWDLAKGTNPMLRFYKRVIAVRNANSALQSGNPVVLSVNDAQNTFAFSRTFEGDAAIVAQNSSTTNQSISITVPAALRNRNVLDALSGRRYAATSSTLDLSLGPRRTAILVPAFGLNLAFLTPH